MLGAHLSIAGGMVNALLQARAYRMDCVQVFTANQRQWRARQIDEAERAEWLEQLQRMGWDSLASEMRGPHRVVSHNSYLINLASPDDELWRKSIDSQRAELERCESLRIPLCVGHPGAHLGAPRPVGEANRLDGSISRAEAAGLRRIVRALDRLHRELPGYRVITCLETTVGSGTNLGYSFHQLAFIRERVRQPERVGFCFDTCHVTAAGYDMSSPSQAAAVLEEWDSIVGLGNLRAFHFNDSAAARGSRRDRHAHITQGCCGRSCFHVILNHPALAAVPKLLETPKETNEKGVAWDLINLRRLRRMRQRVARAPMLVTQ